PRRRGGRRKADASLDRLSTLPTLPAPAGEKPALGPVDPVLAALAIALLGFGVVMVFGSSAIEATVGWRDPFYFLKRQAAFACAGVAVMMLLAHFDYRRLRRFTYPALIGVTVLL